MKPTTSKKRDPERTRELILEAAREVLAQSGMEGLSVAQVAQRAGVNRGTAYQHFQTREQLIEATAEWVSDQLYQAVFGEPERFRGGAARAGDVEGVIEHLANFAMENPALGRVWLFQVLGAGLSSNDPFWQQYESEFKRFAETRLAQPGIDVEVLSVLFIAGSFIWSVWARSRVRGPKQREEMARRFSQEILRLCLFGTMRPEQYPELAARVKRAATPPQKKRRS